MKTKEEISAIKRNAVNIRWTRFHADCGKMSNAEFRALTRQWTAHELAAMIGVTYGNIIGWRRLSHPVMIPDRIADRIIYIHARENMRTATCVPAQKQ